ncbi:MAG: DUF2905 domain-containing protein [Vicingaceae bacterium]
MQEIGKYIIVAGLGILIIGVLLYFFGNKFSWFGNLPGDIRIEKENFRFYMPITSMILISIAISAMLWIVKKLFN